MFPICLCFYRSKPEDMDLQGEPVAINEDDNAFNRVEPEEVHWSTGEVFRTPVFWVLMFVRCVTSAIGTALTFYIKDIGVVSGITEL